MNVPSGAVVLTPAGQRSRADALKLLDAHSPLTTLSGAQQDALRDLLRTLVTERERVDLRPC